MNAVETYRQVERLGLLGMWLVAKSPADRRYPCRCVLGKRCNPMWCPCRGRTDVDKLPSFCCTRPKRVEITDDMPAVDASRIDEHPEED